MAHDLLLAPLGITGMRLAGTDDTRASEVFHWQKPNRNYMDVLGAPDPGSPRRPTSCAIVDSLVAGTPGFHPLSPGHG